MHSITQKTRKELWGKAAGRCSICNVRLFDASHVCIGEECHIISPAPTGPRHQDGIVDYNSYDNLILLCCNHHTKIDTNPNFYTIEKLKEIKDDHEKKVDTWLRKGGKTVELLFNITNAQVLCSMLWGCHAFSVSYADKTTDLTSLQNTLIDTLQQTLDLQYDMSSPDQKVLQENLDSIIIKAQKENTFIYACVSKINIQGIETNSINIILCNRAHKFIVVERNE